MHPREQAQAQTAIQQSRSLQQLYQLLIQPIAADLPSNPNSLALAIAPLLYTLDLLRE